MKPRDSHPLASELSLSPEEEAQLAHRVRHYPESFQRAYIAYFATQDRVHLGRLAAGILEFHADNISSEEIEAIGGDFNLRTDVTMDSITLAEIAFEIEELFDTPMTNHTLGSLKTLNDLANFIEQKRVKE
ncbi:MAG: acyl carrier protein [Verrucomicrobiota bacterium]